jgi:hypothetical protein
MHIAGDVTGKGSFTGGNTRNQMEREATAINPTRTRRLSVSKPEPGSKGDSWEKYNASSADTAYYDSQALCLDTETRTSAGSFMPKMRAGN